MKQQIQTLQSLTGIGDRNQRHLGLYHEHPSKHHLPPPNFPVIAQMNMKRNFSPPAPCNVHVQLNYVRSMGRENISWLRMLTWLSQAVRSKFFHATERRAELAPLFLIAKGVDHPNTHAGAGKKEQDGLQYVNTALEAALLPPAPMHTEREQN